MSHGWNSGYGSTNNRPEGTALDVLAAEADMHAIAKQGAKGQHLAGGPINAGAYQWEGGGLERERTRAGVLPAAPTRLNGVPAGLEDFLELLVQLIAVGLAAGLDANLAQQVGVHACCLPDLRPKTIGGSAWVDGASAKSLQNNPPLLPQPPPYRSTRFFFFSPLWTEPSFAAVKASS